MPPSAKIVVKSTTKISLHERFTELRKLAPVEPPPPAPAPRRAAPAVAKPHLDPVRPRYDLPYSLVAQHRVAAAVPEPQFERFQEPPYERYHGVGRSRSLAERIADGVYLPSRRPAFEAAFKIQRRSIQHRLGGGFEARERPYGRYRGGGGGGAGGAFRGWRPRYGLRFGRGGGAGLRGFRRSRSFQVT
jgi:hypothetical protein